MTDYKISGARLTSIANAIRGKTGKEDSLNLEQMVTEIEGIETGGGSTGEINITENGTYDVTRYASANVALPEAEQATPTISVSSSGLITAMTTQEAGVVPAGTKSNTKQLTIQAAKTITPGTSSQTAVSSGRYTTGTVTVAGDSALVAGNIKKGISIFGVAGTYESSGSSAPTMQAKSVTPSETAQTVTADSGYDGLSSVSVGAISKTYIGSGVTKKSAQTYTPGTSNQTIAAGQYLNGTQTIAGDADLVAENIKSGVSIFNVLGTFTGESGGGGLPDGISALASGEVTPATDSTSTLQVTHDLGVAPNFCLWWDTTDYSNSVGKSVAIGGGTIDKTVRYNASGSLSYNILYFIAGYNASSSLTLTGSRASNSTDMTSTTVSFRTNSTYPFKAGHTYQWVCGVMG